MALIRLDKVGADTHLDFVEIPAGGVPNGAILELGAYKEQDYFEGKLVADIKNELAFCVDPFLNKTGLELEENYVLKEGKKVRGYKFRPGEIITITIDGITGATNIKTNMVGKYAVPEVGKTALKINATKEGYLAFKVIDVDALNGKDALVLRVEK